MLVVNLEVGHLDVVVGIGRGLVGDPVEQFLASPRYQTWVVWRAHHGVTFAGARLSVGKNASVVAFKIVIEEFFTKRTIDVLLVGIVRVGFVV